MSEGIENETWFDNVEHCWFGFEEGIYTARFFGNFHGDIEIVWTGADAYLSKNNWERYIETGIVLENEDDLSDIHIKIPSEILKKISNPKKS